MYCWNNFNLCYVRCSVIFLSWISALIKFDFIVYIPSSPKKELAQFLKNVSSLVPGLHVVDVDIPLSILCKDDNKLKQVALDREFHISLGRTVPIRVNQIDSVVTMLRQKLQFQRWSDYLLPLFTCLINSHIISCPDQVSMNFNSSFYFKTGIGLNLISGRFLSTMIRHAPFFH